MTEPGVPQIDLQVIPESAQIRAGEQVTVAWSVRHAERVYLRRRAGGVLDSPPVDWGRLRQREQGIEPEGRLTVTPSVTTAYTLAALGRGGRQARSVSVEVVIEQRPRRESRIWSREWERLPLDWRRGFEAGVRRWASCMGRDAALAFSVSPRAVFDDEEVTLDWEITCSDCAEMSAAGGHVILLEDLGRPSGTRDAFGVAWASHPLACSLSMSGSARVGASSGPGSYRWTVLAEGLWGSAASASARAGFLPHPRFDGADAQRQREIEGALKDIYSGLLDGCIRDAADLDDTVAAFRDGRLSRTAIWLRLLAELENANLIAFVCEDVAEYGPGAQPGSRADYTNEIHLRWTADDGPNLPYVILHELIHKAGFHGDLLEHYSVDEIEEQAHLVTAACL